MPQITAEELKKSDERVAALRRRLEDERDHETRAILIKEIEKASAEHRALAQQYTKGMQERCMKDHLKRMRG